VTLHELLSQRYDELCHPKPSFDKFMFFITLGVHVHLDGVGGGCFNPKFNIGLAVEIIRAESKPND
jgi:hypothetical protein